MIIKPLVKVELFPEPGSYVRIEAHEDINGCLLCFLVDDTGRILGTCKRARPLADWALDCHVKEVRFCYDLGAFDV